MRIHFKVTMMVIIVSAIGIGSILLRRYALSEEQALTMIYGNYDHINKYANWINIPFPDKKDAEGYFEERKGLVKVISFQPYYENGKNKVFLLTKTIPTNIPFDCHACLPLIGAAIFVGKNRHWEIEAQNQFIMYDGEYGELPIVKMIEIGKDKFGFTLEFEHIAETNREISIFVPYKNTILNAHKEVIYYNNFSDCASSDAIQCVAYTSNIDFISSKNETYYSIKIKKFGTIFSDKKNKSVPIDENITYRFLNGKYVEVNHAGYKEVI